MTSNDQDLQFLTEALPQVQDYLLSNELGSSLPRLTPGAVLLALARLSASQPGQAEKLRAELESIRAKRRVTWEQKAARETANRLRLWAQFLADYRSAPDQHADSYPQEVRGRAILQLLLAEAPNAPEKTALAELDTLLKAHLRPDGFVWNPALESAFPPNDFWFLYGRLA